MAVNGAIRSTAMRFKASNDRIIRVLFVLIGLGIVVNFIRVFTAQLLGG